MKTVHGSMNDVSDYVEGKAESVRLSWLLRRTTRREASRLLGNARVVHGSVMTEVGTLMEVANMETKSLSGKLIIGTITEYIHVPVHAE